MTTYRENLIDRMIRLYGYEAQVVIDFANLCERLAESDINNNALRALVESHEVYPVI